MEKSRVQGNQGRATAEGGTKQTSTIRVDVYVVNVCEIVPRAQVVILHIDKTTEKEEVTDTLKMHFGKNRYGEIKTLTHL